MKTLAVITLGVLLGIASMLLWQGWNTAPPANTQESEPLYWVAPMDANYRRDQPGKSPMGMDLVPVYAEAQDNPYGPGTVRISPDLVNNLGVRTMVAEQRRLETTIRTVGYVQYDEDRLVHVHPRVEGWIEKLHVKTAGNPVVEGQPLYELYSPQLVNAQEEFLLALKRDSQELIQAAEGRLLALQLTAPFIKNLRRRREVESPVTFRAPQSGVLDHLEVREGFFVQPGTTLMSIGSLAMVWVEAEVFERESSLVAEGLPVTMTLDYLPDRSWQGSIDYVYPSLDPVTRTTRVRLRFANEDRVLKPNMFTQVLIHAEDSTTRLVVPSEAVIRTGDQDRVVLALGEGRFKSVAVGLGRMTDRYTEITEGLGIDDRVVVSAQFLLDSESSKTSDFLRFGATPPEPERKNPEPVQTATVNGTINRIDIVERQLNISRGPIPQWNRPAMTMDFKVADDIDLAALTEAQKIRFSFSVENGNFTVRTIETLSVEEPAP